MATEDPLDEIVRLAARWAESEAEVASADCHYAKAAEHLGRMHKKREAAEHDFKLAIDKLKHETGD